MCFKLDFDFLRRKVSRKVPQKVPEQLIQQRLMNKEREPINNPDFKPIEFNRFKTTSKTNRAKRQRHKK